MLQNQKQVFPTTLAKTLQKINFRHRPQTNFIRLVSSKLVLRGVPIARDGRFDSFFEKQQKTPNNKHDVPKDKIRVF